MIKSGLFLTCLVIEVADEIERKLELIGNCFHEKIERIDSNLAQVAFHSQEGVLCKKEGRFGNKF